MNELLFESVIEKEALENLLALNQIKKCDDEINRYTEEIKELNSEMTSILRNENISEDYVEKIHKYKRVLSSLEGENGRMMELDSKIEENENRIKEFQAKAGEIEERLEILKKEIFETSNPEKVIDCQNEIETNNVRLNDINEIITKLVSDNTPLLIEKEYLAAKNSGVDFNIPNFNKKEIQTDLDRITKVFNDQIEKLDLPIFDLCLENSHINMAITKILGMIRAKNIKKIIFASVDKSPHCVQIHYIQDEIRKLGFKV